MKTKTKASPVKVTGPLARYTVGFKEELADEGYTPLSAANLLRLMAHLSRWMAALNIGPDALGPDRIQEFLEARRSAGYTCLLSQHGLRPLLTYLRHRGVVPTIVEQAPSSPLEVLLAEYGDYLLQERGVTSPTAQNYVKIARQFLAEWTGPDGLDLAGLDAGGVTTFVVRECPCHCVGTAKYIVTALRSLLRYLHLLGWIDAPLASAVPAVAGWRMSGLPKALETDQIKGLLRSCDRRRSVDRRDYAILVLLIRLGLRAGEVTALELDDIDWRTGELIIRGKGSCQESLPLPMDVGEALAGYVRRGRPRRSSRRVFLGSRAPYRPLSNSAISAIVHRACNRAGVPPVGAHYLRHSAATAMLRAGASLAEVGQVLRHRCETTTAIYAKVDRRSLRSLARPWPEIALVETDVDRAGLRTLARRWPGGAA